MSKPKPGVCGTCGVAVVQPEKPTLGWQHREGCVYGGWGHFFEEGYRIRLDLIKVRCQRHGDPFDGQPTTSKERERFPQ